MLIPVEWLRELVDLPEELASPEELADRLTITGNEIEEIRESEVGPVFYLKLTPNRGDMLSLRGAAREIAALYERSIRESHTETLATGPSEGSVRIEVEAPDLCSRYVARIIRGVKVGPSPEWLRQRLEAVGLRSISNVVDVTNYVMFEQGQPLHAFDLDLLRESRIVVRRARAGETITAIDGSEVRPTPEMLVIADGERPVAVAGVMGGRDTEVSEGTVSVLLESAYFDPVSVRRTSKRTGLASPSSYRFERGIDPNNVRTAADRAAALIAELAGGTVSETVFDLYPAPISPKRIPFRPERCRAMLGISVSDEETAAFLARLGLEVERGEGQWIVTAPTSRPDLAIEEDIIEEVGRLFGYDRLPETLPAGASGAGSLSPLERLTRATREGLLAQGMYEAVTSTLIADTFLSRARLERSPVWPSEGAVTSLSLVNALSEEFNTLRPSLLPGLLLSLRHNLRHGVRDAALFEIGYVHSHLDGRPTDHTLVGGVLLGSRWSGVWNADKALAADFYTAKGAVEGLASALSIGELAAERAEHPAFHPGRAAWLSLTEQGGERLGIVGELHPEVATALDFPRGVYLFELDGDLLLRHSSEEHRYAPPSRFPRALRDMAVVVDRTVPSADIEQVLRQAMGEFGRSVRLFDVYAGKPLPEEKVSLAYALELGSDDRTLTDEEVESRLTAARERLVTEFGAEFRG